MANNLGQRDHGLNIPIQLGKLNDAEKQSLLSNIKQVAQQMQNTLDDAIKQGIEDGARSANIKDALTQFNKQLKAAKLEPLTITVDELRIMDKPIEHAAKLVIQKLTDAFKGGGLGNIISSEITDSLNALDGTVDKIYQKMEQGAKKSAGNMIRSMEEVAKAASKITTETDKKDIRRALSGRMEATTDKTGKSDPKRNYQALYSTSKNMVETDDNFVEKYKADLKFARNFEKLSEAQRKDFYGKELADVTAHYNKLQETIHQKMMVLNNILAEVGFTDKKGNAYVHQGGEPWAREKTLQEVKNILKGGLTVKDGGSESSRNLNTSKLEADLSKTIESRIAVEKKVEEAAREIAEMHTKPKRGYRGVTIPQDGYTKPEGDPEWFSSDKTVAETYTFDEKGSAVIVADIVPQKTLSIDAGGKNFDEFDQMPGVLEHFPEVIAQIKSGVFKTADEIQLYISQKATELGYDLLEITNVIDSMNPAVYKQPSTVYGVLNEGARNIQGAYSDTGEDDEIADFSDEMSEVPEWYKYSNDKFQENINLSKQASAAISQQNEELKEYISLNNQADAADDTSNGAIFNAGGDVIPQGGSSELDGGYDSGISTKLSEVLSGLTTAITNLKSNVTGPEEGGTESTLLTNINTTLGNLTTAISNLQSNDNNNKVAIDTEGLQSVLTAITFKVQDISEKEQVNSAIDQESINSLVSAIKTAVTPQSDGESKSTAPWAKDETLRNITGKTLGKIANSVPKVDTKGLAKNDTLNQVAQATKAINNKISGKITGNVKDIKANQEKVATDKRNNEVKALLDQFRQLGQKDAQKSLATGDERAALEKEIKGLQMRLGKQRKALGVDESMTKAARIEGKDVAINTHNEEVAQKEANITKELTKVYDEYISLMDKRENIALKMVGLDPVKNQKELDALRKYYDVVDNIIHTEYGDVLGNPEVQKRFTVGDFAEPYEEWQRKGAVKTGKAEDAAKQKEINALYREYIGLMNERESKNAKLAGLDAKRDAEQITALESSISQIEDRMQETFGSILGDKVATSIFSADDFQKHYEKWQRKIQEAEGKKRDKDAKKTLDEEIKAARKQNNLDIADSTYNSARKTMASLWQLDSSIDPASIPQVQALQSEMQELDTIYKQVNDKIRASQSLSDEEIKDLQLTSNMTAQKTEKLKELIQNYTKLQNGEEIGQYVGGAGSEQEQLQKAINDRFGGKAKIKEYKQNSDGTISAVASVKTGTRAFTEYTVAVSQADKKIKMLTGTTKQLPSFLDGVKRKLGEISQYVSAMSVISRAGMELRKGIQYVRDIDLALTELKKVTDETEESYEKFLDTASKTAAKVGSTIKDVISSTADWARLGYSMEQAAKFAESTQILMNVSEFTDVSAATDTLISAVQAFEYTAESSMEVVDLLNTIGNNYAISTADLAKSLTKSSASLVAAGGDLAEAAALTATANAIIQD